MPVTGYTKLAKFMTENRHIIVRGYSHLALRDLLYLQAEICHLEHEYNEVAARDASEKDERRCYDREWRVLESSQRRGFEGRQWAVAMRLREKLREYYTATLQYSKITALASPKKQQREILQHWIDRPSLGGGCGFLGRDLSNFQQAFAYAEENKGDLVMLTPTHGEEDSLTKFIAGPLLDAFHWVWKHRKSPVPIDPENPPVGENRSGLHAYSHRRVQPVIYVLGTVLSSIVPLFSIVVLNLVKDANAKLGIVCGFTILFSLFLALATSARRIEIFAATAAFASVQVVFLGSTNN